MSKALRLKLWIAVYDVLEHSHEANCLDREDDDCTTAEQAASVAERAVEEFLNRRKVEKAAA